MEVALSSFHLPTIVVSVVGRIIILKFKLGPMMLYTQSVTVLSPQSAVRSPQSLLYWPFGGRATVYFKYIFRLVWSNHFCDVSFAKFNHVDPQKHKNQQIWHHFALFAVFAAEFQFRGDRTCHGDSAGRYQRLGKTRPNRSFSCGGTCS